MKLSLKFFKKLPNKEKRITLPTQVTLIRLFLVPFIVTSMIYHKWGIAFLLFCIAALTDIVDGFLARYLNQKTFLGACLDPVADKLLIVSTFFTLSFVQSPLFSIPLWFVWLVLVKELILIFGAILIYYIKGFLQVEPTLLGKLTMAVQVIFVIWLFACYFFHWLPIKTYYLMLSVVTILVLSSLLQYAKIGIKQFKINIR